MNISRTYDNPIATKIVEETPAPTVLAEEIVPQASVQAMDAGSLKSELIDPSADVPTGDYWINGWLITVTSEGLTLKAESSRPESARSLKSGASVILKHSGAGDMLVSMIRLTDRNAQEAVLEPGVLVPAVETTVPETLTATEQEAPE